ncbi:MAG: PLDc N-terminal domain-containing protein [Alistipes sp.]|nr:PLDc N-terminal domain-containing protein [Alistipes sp.]
MIATILFVAGLILAIWCVLDILKQPISLVGKVIVAVVVLATNWLGLLLYYFWARHHLTSWFK